MNNLSSFLKAKSPLGASPAASSTPTANPAEPTSPASKFGLPSMGKFSIPGITVPGITLGFAALGIDSCHNVNDMPKGCLHPSTPGSGHPDFSIAHEALRGAMHFPKTFATRMDKQPVILVPPTGGYSGSVYRYNFAKLFEDQGFANHMWINIPGAQCDDSWKNAEYVAYAIQYVFELTGRKVAVVGFSQGNLSIQWTLKYWPGTRDMVNNFIAISADFHGTLCAYAAPLPTNPSILHQRYYSNFIRTLRSNGGDSAYVPTTSVYSSWFDEIVQPQAGDGASAFLKDDRQVGVLNVDLQNVCPLTPASSFFGHGGVIYNPVAWALTKDAIVNGGPAQLERIDLRTTSMAFLAPGLTIVDIELTLAQAVPVFTSMLRFLPKHFHEPPLPAYAQAELKALPPAPQFTPEQQKIIDQSKKQAAFTGLPAALNPMKVASAMLNHVKTGQAPNTETLL